MGCRVLIWGRRTRSLLLPNTGQATAARPGGRPGGYAGRRGRATGDYWLRSRRPSPRCRPGHGLFQSWNGEKLDGHYYLLTDVLKEEMGFAGFLISDWAGIDQLPVYYASDVRTAINAGIDMVMVPEDDYRRFVSTLRAEIEAGNIPIERIDEAVSATLAAKFDPASSSDPSPTGESIEDVGSPEHREVARQAVRQLLVLLKNDVWACCRCPRRARTSTWPASTLATSATSPARPWTISWAGHQRRHHAGHHHPGGHRGRGRRRHQRAGS